ncbi:MAG: hypothetical protein A3H02_01400 [Candidatus Niyogibacteria bacterium RIFCSPLOWO2_12_FULL_41_13]|uniref:Uncharacterized protein n=1 Tax=Candidatus Niyogibacteria bacterium RIFCSPLOWO2_12_FULL_41_13 TaxID=1801726 RepID=A0A1G2F1R3_9BACT|nr:MAG: hypothetical protein A3H02_01400 [Candidatus Niyogibacteria bacterium RIFCSPLOWO2_12_FULL_41_13]
MATLSNKAWIFIIIFVLAFGFVIGYSFGKSVGFNANQELLKSEVNKAQQGILDLQKKLENFKF